MNNKINKNALIDEKALLQEQYRLAKGADKGAEVGCAYCNKPLVKYRGKIFCTNFRHNTKDNCKDNFYNSFKRIDHYLKFFQETDEEEGVTP